MIRYTVNRFLLLLTMLLVGCSAMTQLEEPPRISLIGLKPLELGLLEQRYSLRLRIQNPNKVDLDIQGLDYSISVNGRDFARGVSDEEARIPAFGEGIIEVDVISNLSSLVRQLKLLSERGAPFKYRIEGRIALRGIPGTVPFSHEGELLLGDGLMVSSFR